MAEIKAVRSQLDRVLQAVITIQTFYRACLLKRIQTQELRERRERCAIKLQAFYRGYLVRRSIRSRDRRIRMAEAFYYFGEMRTKLLGEA